MSAPTPTQRRQGDGKTPESSPLVPVVPVPESAETTHVATLTEPEPAAEEAVSAGVMWAIVFAGGIGSRFWPLSTPECPKQLLALIGERPLIADTVSRFAPLVPAERVLVLTSRDIADAIRSAIPEVPADNMLVEPSPIGTAAALAWGAQEVKRRAGPKAVCFGVHADLAVAFPDAFRMTLRTAAEFASREPVLVVLGIRPTRPETAFGYIRPARVSRPGHMSAPCRVRTFVEKPGPILAAELIEDGALWHAGIVVSEAETVLNELARHTHELAPGLDALAAGDAERFAGMIQEASIERELLERSDKVVVLPAEFGWDDVGTWASLRRARDLDDQGNGARGPVYLVESTANVVHSMAGTTVLYGVSGMLVVSLRGLTFVTTLERAKDLRPLLDALPPGMRHKPVQP
jgi:mannose-1-phosphate guanylyltransferase